MNAFRAALAVSRKDFSLLFRTRQQLLHTLFFAFLTLIVFHFAFDPGSGASREAAPGILWVAFFFSGMLALDHSFASEQEEGCLAGLLLSPASREGLFTGKFLANAGFLLLLQGLILPVFTVLFNIQPGWHLLWLAPVVILADAGFASTGTLLAALTSSMRSRGVLLPVLLFPVVLPIAIAAVQATSPILRGEAPTDAWLKLLLGFDLVFLPACAFLFRHVLDEN